MIFFSPYFHDCTSYFLFFCSSSLQPNIYIRDLFVYINILAIVLVAITIVLRGFQSSIQWPFAALAYLTYSMLALEYLSLWKWVWSLDKCVLKSSSIFALRLHTWQCICQHAMFITCYILYVSALHIILWPFTMWHPTWYIGAHT